MLAAEYNGWSSGASIDYMQVMDPKPSLSQRATAANAVSAPPSDYLQGLNPEQRKAVLHIGGPLLVLAGAGTGKTRVLTTRIAHILMSGAAAANQILAVTFTNKAAREMRDRIERLVGPKADSMRWIGTFHSISAQILRRHAELAGLKSNFSIIDTDDQIRLCKEIIRSGGLDEKRWTGRGFAAVIDEWKNSGLHPSDLKQDDAHRFGAGHAIDLYTAYQSRLRDLNAADFGDLLLHCLRIFREHDDLLAEYRTKFQYILVDEYQDTNTSQYLWLRLLCTPSNGERRNICVVGDDDQSIYGWRGAEVANILNFEDDFPGCETVRLEQNYRSTSAILGAASALITHNADRLGKTLWTDEKGGEKLKLRGLWDAEAEAREIVADIEARHTHGGSYSDFAILVRASFQMRSFEERLNLAGLPYRVVGGPRFYEREETRDALAYLRLVQNPDDDLSFQRVVNKPRRGIGDIAEASLTELARQYGISLRAAATLALERGELKGKSRSALRLFLAQLDAWRASAEKSPPADIAKTVLDDSGYTDFWKQSKNAQAAGKLENLKEVVRAAGEFPTLEGYLDHVSLVAERTETSFSQGAVWLMTLHAAKGLEFPVVYLPGWEEEIFPSARSIDENGVKGLEEERRLAYVGITRARKVCHISFVANRQIYGRWQSAIPSRFVDELPEDQVEIISQPGLYGTQASDLPSHSRFDDISAAGVYATPGMRRATAQRSSNVSPPPTIEMPARLIASTAPGAAGFAIGERVFHQKFGYGVVENIEGAKVQVAFDKAGTKKVVASYLQNADDV